MIREYEAAGSFLRALGELHWTNKFMFPRMEKLSCFGTSSHVALGFLAIRFCLLFSMLFR
jgi:hypothetical protein